MKFKYSLLLVLTAMIWGAAFVAQSAGMDHMGPYTFNCLRFFLGAIALTPVIIIKDKRSKTEITKWNDKSLWVGGMLCGLFLFLASTAQQLGIVTTSAGKAGFITAFYIVMVPVLSLFMGKKTGKFIWVSVALALFGLFLLCMKGERFTIVPADILLFACAILFALQILAVDKYAPNVDCLKLSRFQFLVSGILGIVPMLFEAPKLSEIFGGWIALGYAGFFSCGIAYTLQMVAQKEVKPAVASIIMSLEAVFSVIFGFLILREKLTLRELAGCLVMFTAVMLTHIHQRKKYKAVAVGERVFLRNMRNKDTDDIVRWRNEPTVVNNFIYRKPVTKQDHKNWIKTKVKTGLVRQFIICLNDTGKGFGSIYFRDIDNTAHTCEFGIFIGEPDMQGKGYGYEAQKLSMDIAFNEMGMKTVDLRVLEKNTAAIKNYEKCGFKVMEGKEEYTEDNEKILFMRAVKEQ